VADIRGVLDDCFEQAATAVGVADHWIRIGDAAVRIRLAGGDLEAPILSAFAHAATPPAETADLTVMVWDAASSGVSPPLPAVPEGESRGAWLVNDDQAVRMAYRPGWRSLHAFDVERSVGWHWVGDARAVPFWSASSPLRPLLHWWALTRGELLVHGGVVGESGGGVLLVGRSGSGKSTTTLACLGAGMGYAGDDYVLLSPGRPPEVASLYSTAKIEWHQAQRFPSLLPRTANDDGDEKALGFLAEAYPDRMLHTVPLAAVAACRVSGGAITEVRTISRAKALAALAPSTILQTPGSSQDELAFIAEALSGVPCFAIDLGHDLSTIAPAVRSMLR
jgi:hypothetical protein